MAQPNPINPYISNIKKNSGSTQLTTQDAAKATKSTNTQFQKHQTKLQFNNKRDLQKKNKKNKKKRNIDSSTT